MSFSFPRLRLSTPAWFALSLLAVAVGIVLTNLEAPPEILSKVWPVAMGLFVLTTLTALYRSVRGAVVLARRADTVDLGASVVATLGNLLMTAFGMLIAYFATVGFSRGRQLRRFGRIQLPEILSSSAWTSGTVSLDRRMEVPDGVADQWRENGRTEHASVAAFARLTLDLMALGAPPHLIAAANQDALDEIRHAELCFSLACALDGKTVSPGPFPVAQRVASLSRSRPLALAKLAVDSLVDGALHEGVSARIIAKLARRAQVSAIHTVLKEIAADEGRHAAHGWAVAEWCLDEGGPRVGAALLGALQGLPARIHSQLPASAADGGWEPWGIHGHRLESEEYAAALTQLAERVSDKVARARRVA
jgi:hypothetical protein